MTQNINMQRLEGETEQAPYSGPGALLGDVGGAEEEGEGAPRRPAFAAGSPLRSQLAGGQSHGLRIQRSFRPHQPLGPASFPHLFAPSRVLPDAPTPPRHQGWPLGTPSFAVFIY